MRRGQMKPGSFMSDDSATLVCRNLWKVFGARATEAFSTAGGDAARLAALGLVPAVRAVDLSVRRGEIFVIMGLSGSGKSTLVRLMSRLIEPTSGQVLFNGQDLLTTNEAEMTQIRRHKMGMVFQHFALLPHLTVLENVAFPLDVQGVARPEREARAREMIALVGLAGREGAYPRQLSGGQQQRVGIARSLAVEPELWFLDEPFSALDPLIRRELQDEFIRLQSRLQKLQGRLQFGGALSGRDANAAQKTMNGLLKLMFPDASAKIPNDAIEWAARLALECRRRVKERRAHIRPGQTFLAHIIPDIRQQFDDQRVVAVFLDYFRALS